jgi:hypothetical protein
MLIPLQTDFGDIAADAIQDAGKEIENECYIWQTNS